jgi:hypothetical protein
LQELGSDAVGAAYCTVTVTVWDDDPRIADERLRLVEKVIQGRDFTCMVEKVNAVDAWLGSLPGHAYANVRQPPVSTLNLAHMIPLSAVWAGPARTSISDAPPLFFGRTEGATPFRFSLHVGDVGHTLVVGPTGGQVRAAGSHGFAVPALRQGAGVRLRLRRFDPRRCARDGRRLARSRRALVEEEREPVALQPLALHRRCRGAGLGGGLDRSSPGAREDRHHAGGEGSSLVGSGHRWPPHRCRRAHADRPVGAVAVDRAQAGAPALLPGRFPMAVCSMPRPSGSADVEVQVFETEGLIGTGAAAAVLAYLFHRIEARLDGRPTLLIVDEGWLALDDEALPASCANG